MAELLGEQVKARVTKAERNAVDKLAEALRVSNAYIVREALSEYFHKRRVKLDGAAK